MSKQIQTTVLDPTEIKQLINVFNSELRQLNYRTLSIQKNIEQLEQALSKVVEVESSSMIEPMMVLAQTAPLAKEPKAATPKAAPAAKEEEAIKPATIKSSTTSKTKTPKKVAMPKPVVARRRRKLSPWDEFIMTALEEGDQVLIMSEFLEIVKNNFSEAKGWSEAKIKSKLNAVFHKLANKKGNIVKISFEGRGFAYALPNWLNPAGELKKKYQR
ncbi:MAG: hypothetical protein R2828_24045 [Saprospiraceae bacterium]